MKEIILERHTLPKLTQKEVYNLKKPSSRSTEEIKSVINNLPKYGTLGPHEFTGEFY